MKIALLAGLITSVIILVVKLFNMFDISDLYINGKYDVIILYYVIINSLYLEKLVSKSNTKTN